MIVVIIRDAVDADAGSFLAGASLGCFVDEDLGKWARGEIISVTYYKPPSIFHTSCLIPFGRLEVENSGL